MPVSRWRHPARRWVLALARAGKLSSLAEAALIADVSRQTVLNWLNEAGGDLGRWRLAGLAKLRSEVQSSIELAETRQSRQGRKRARYEAIRRFNRANGRH